MAESLFYSRPGFSSKPTTKRRDGHCLVVCSCGHENIGDFFDNVTSGQQKDAWWQYRLHVEAKHPLPPTEAEALEAVVDAARCELRLWVDHTIRPEVERLREALAVLDRVRAE